MDVCERVGPAGAAVVWAGCIDLRGARARAAASARTAERHPRTAAQSAAGRQPSDCRRQRRAREPSVATFDIQRATTLVQPQIAYLTGIALVLSLRNYWKLATTT